MQDQQQPAPDFGEPWSLSSFRNCIFTRDGKLEEIIDSLRNRSFRCVNACAGIANLDGIAVMRKALWDMSTGSIPSGEVRALATHALNVLRGDSQPQSQS